jgi:hypothetical protein
MNDLSKDLGYRMGFEVRPWDERVDWGALTHNSIVVERMMEAEIHESRALIKHLQTYKQDAYKWQIMQDSWLVRLACWIRGLK